MAPEQQFYEQAETMQDAVWRICSYLRNDECCECPHAEWLESHGTIAHRGCRMLAEEAVAIVLEAAALTSAAGSTPERP